MQYALPVEAPQRSAGSVCRRKKPSETKFTKTDCCFFANKRYLCPRKEVAPPSKDSVVRATHAKAGVQSGADDRFSGRNTNRFPQGSSNGGMVDTKDLKSFGHCGCAGSSPASSTESHAEYSAWLSCFYSSESLRQDSFHYITLCDFLLLRFMVSCFCALSFLVMALSDRPVIKNAVAEFCDGVGILSL